MIEKQRDEKSDEVKARTRAGGETKVFAWNESKTANETKDYHDKSTPITSVIPRRLLRPVTDLARREERMVDEGALRAVPSLIFEEMGARRGRTDVRRLGRLELGSWNGRRGGGIGVQVRVEVDGEVLAWNEKLRGESAPLSPFSDRPSRSLGRRENRSECKVSKLNESGVKRSYRKRRQRSKIKESGQSKNESIDASRTQLPLANLTCLLVPTPGRGGRADSSKTGSPAFESEGSILGVAGCLRIE